MRRLILCALVGAVALAACGRNGASDVAASAAALPTVASHPTTAPTTLAAPTTSAMPTTTTTAPCSAGEHRNAGDIACVSDTTTTTVNHSALADVKVIAVLSAMATSQRDGFISAVESEFPSVSVENFDVVASPPPDRSYLTMTVDTGFMTPANQQHEVWELVYGLSDFWNDTKGPLRNDVGTVKPGFIIKAHGKTYDSSYDVMVAVADRRMAEDQWFASV
jgi:hypothetical protein